METDMQKEFVKTLSSIDYNSFCGSMTVPEAIEHLGKQHVRWLLGDWDQRITNSTQGAWQANLGRAHTAYCALMQAGSGAVEIVMEATPDEHE